MLFEIGLPRKFAKLSKILWKFGSFGKEFRWTKFNAVEGIMYVPLQVNRFYESILLIVQYRYFKSVSRDFYVPESDPPHKIMRYWFYYSICLVFSFRPRWSC